MAEPETEMPIANPATPGMGDVTEIDRTAPEVAPVFGGEPVAAYVALTRSARIVDLVAITKAIVSQATKAKSTEWNFTAEIAAAAEQAKLPHAEANTPFGNALAVLASGPTNEAEHALGCALVAHAVATAHRDDTNRTAGDALWLATHTPFNAMVLFDQALGETADDFWVEIANRVKCILANKAGAGHAEAMVGLFALASSTSARARMLSRELAVLARDPLIARIATSTESKSESQPPEDVLHEEVHIPGEVMPAPRGPITTTLLALSGLLFVIHGVRLFGRLALGFERPGELVVSARGIRLRATTRMLGRTLRCREHVIVRAGLVRVTREVRYPRAAFYAGLLALALGSWLGVHTLIDGLRAASPSLLVVGLAVVTIGIAADFLLSSLLPGSRGRCRIAIVPRTGRTLCLGNVDAERASVVLASIFKADN
ncbi:MAG: hypothetical protein FWD73_11245 [Polyangiaceae bacterium]|nr:hypothetical protein [Polyangiaceae bacterium]